MKILILISAIVFSVTILSSQSILKSDYSNVASGGFDFGLSKNTGNDDYIVHFGSKSRYRIINTGFDVSSTLGDSLLTLRNAYFSIKGGLALPLLYRKYSTTTLNVNATYNLFDKLSNDKINGAFGFETYVKYNTAFANIEIGYSGNPNSDNSRLNRKGAFVRLGIGLNEFFSRKKGWSLQNQYNGINNADKIELKKGDKVQGSGFAISSDGYLITNYHVIKDGKKIIVHGVNGNADTELEAKVVSFDKEADVAILKVNNRIENIPYHFKTKEAISGKKIYTLGYPKSHLLGSNVKITEGIINSTSGIADDNTVYQISAPITNGNSGGPLFDEYGNVIGINSSGYRDQSSDLVNYAIKLSQVVPLLEKIEIDDQIMDAYNENIVDGSIIANEYGKYVYLIIVEH